MKPHHNRLIQWATLCVMSLTAAAETGSNGTAAHVQEDFVDLRDSVQLQVSDRECEVQLNPFKQTCETVWRTITSYSTGKDHMHEFVVLKADQEALISRDWRVKVRVGDAHAEEQDVEVLEVSAGMNSVELATKLVEVADNFTQGWKFDVEEMAGDINELRAENRYLIAYYPGLGMRATFTLHLEESERELGRIEVHYPGC